MLNLSLEMETQGAKKLPTHRHAQKTLTSVGTKVRSLLAVCKIQSLIVCVSVSYIGLGLVQIFH